MTASLALDALSLLGGAFAIFVGIADPGQLPTEPVVLIAIVAALLGLVSWWCYTVFLQRLASYLWETELVRFTGSVQALGLMLSGLAPILGIGIYACLRWPADATVTVTMIVVHLVVVVLAVGWPVAGIIFLLVQLRLLERLREAMWSRR